MRTENRTFLSIDVVDEIATVTFLKPTWAFAEEWEVDELFEDLRTDTSVKVVVMTGTGDAFCGGAHHSDDPFDAYGYYERSIRLFGGIIEIDKPMVMAVNGKIGGSGLTFAMFGDIVFAERHVMFRDAHVLGGVVSATGPFQWPPSIGLMRAKRYLLTGDEFTADEAKEMGLVSEVVDTGTSLEHASAMAKRLAEIRPAAVQGTKRALNQWLRRAFQDVMATGLSYEFMRFPEEYAARTRAAAAAAAAAQ
ncbi:MAG: enoyl-CoA hydratase/isomerase [Ilumatobacteraceae bacterium]|nr:enoyl-CoA hydratase/isomerase [Ilumatobacteraceae bacterium]